VGEIGAMREGWEEYVIGTGEGKRREEIVED
jgi:hypothetical protein